MLVDKTRTDETASRLLVDNTRTDGTASRLLVDNTRTDETVVSRLMPSVNEILRKQKRFGIMVLTFRPVTS